jgi:hypothetical protein
MSHHLTEATRRALDRELDELQTDTPIDDAVSTKPQPTLSLVPAALPNTLSAAHPVAIGMGTFPYRPTASLLSEPDRTLLARLDPLTRSPAGKSLQPYMFSQRETYCALNLALNAHGSIPPGFRPARKFAWPKKGVPTPPWSKDLSRDRMILDLHWLHSTGFRQRLHDEKYRDMMVGDEFDFATAAMFTRESWTSEKRASTIMALTDFEQWQLGVLMTGSVRQKLWDLRVQQITIGAKFRGVAQRNSRLNVAHADDFARLWFAHQLCEGRNQGQIAEVHQWLAQASEPLTKATISAKLAKMRKWLAAM